MKIKMTRLVGAMLAACTATMPAYGQQDPNLDPAYATPVATPPSGTATTGPGSIERGSGAARGGTWFSATKFTGKSGASTPPLSYDSFYYFNSPGSTSPALYFAQVDLEPGVVMDRMTCVANDSSATNDFSAELQHATTDFGTSTANWTLVPGSAVATSGSIGIQWIGSNFSATETFKSHASGASEVLHEYFIRASVANDTSFAGCWIYWTRQISPAPVTQSFTDVAPTNTFYQHIEAVKAAGITTGCGGGKFCPNDYVTRGQMAAFLARALGLSYQY